MAEMTLEQQRAIAIATARKRLQEQNAQPAEAVAPSQAYKGSILPFSRDESGNVSFDSDAGLLGPIKRSFMLPGDVMSGKVQMKDGTGNYTPELIGRALEFAGTFSPSTPGLRVGDRAIPGQAKNIARQQVDIPSAEALKAAAREGYDEARDLGVDYAPEAVKNLSDDLARKLFESGLIDETAPKANALVKKLGDVPVAGPGETVAAPLSSLEAAQRSLGNASRNFTNPPDAEAARIARQGLNDFMRNPPEGAVISGDPALASQILRTADANWAAAKKSNTLTGIDEAAGLRADAANSGQNLGNSIRSRIASLLIDKKQASRFSAEEREALKLLDKGTKTENATRWIGNLLGGGGGLGNMVTALGTGAAAAQATGNPLAFAAGVVPSAVGVASKKISNSLTKNHLAQIDEAIRANSPLAKSLIEKAPVAPFREGGKEAIIRALMLQQLNNKDKKFNEALLSGNAT